MSDFHEPDIVAMKLSDVEKNGLQVFRTYTRAFEQHRAQEFLKVVQWDPGVMMDLQSVLKLVAEEEPRSLPVLACAFVDDQLKAMFRREIPEGVPGGRASCCLGSARWLVCPSGCRWRLPLAG